MLVAGTLCAARHWRDYGYVATLARDWRVINVDPLGHGDSDTPHDADSYQAAGVTADLVAVLDAEGIDRATVWGYSRGGWLACSLASHYADRVERIVVAAYAMNAHQEEAGRLLAPLAGFLREGDWSSLWMALRISDREFQEMMQDSNDPLAVARPSMARFGRRDSSIHPQSAAPQRITSDPKTGSCRTCMADVDSLGATLDIIEGQGHMGSFFAAAEPALTIVTARLAQ